MRRTNRRELKEARKRKKITIIFMIVVIYIFICKENLIIVRSVSVYPSYVRHFRSKDFQMLTFEKKYLKMTRETTPNAFKHVL